MFTKLILLTVIANSDVIVEQQGIVEESVVVVQDQVREVSEKTSDVLTEMRVLELLLLDQNNYKKYCADIAWEAPTIEVYREKLTSLLPDSCKERIPEESTPAESK